MTSIFLQLAFYNIRWGHLLKTADRKCLKKKSVQLWTTVPKKIPNLNYEHPSYSVSDREGPFSGAAVNYPLLTSPYVSKPWIPPNEVLLGRKNSAACGRQCGHAAAHKPILAPGSLTGGTGSLMFNWCVTERVTRAAYKKNGLHPEKKNCFGVGESLNDPWVCGRKTRNSSSSVTYLFLKCPVCLCSLMPSGLFPPLSLNYTAALPTATRHGFSSSSTYRIWASPKQQPLQQQKRFFDPDAWHQHASKTAIKEQD